MLRLEFGADDAALDPALIVAVAVVGTTACRGRRPGCGQAQHLQRGAPAATGWPAAAALQYRTTVAPPAYRDPVVIEADPDALITPAYGPGGYIANLPGTPLLPGSSTIPGYYGRAFDYDYQGPYYGGPYVSYWWRLPYACGVYGYC